MRRTLQNVPLLLLISIVLFVILHNAPGGPLAPYLQNPHITAADIKRLEHNFGLDRPLYVQYWGLKLEKVLTGDFGYSTSNSESVLAAILERLPATLELMGSAFFVSLAIGVTVGILSALRPYSWIDYTVTTLAFFGQSMPVFWFALMLQLAFAVNGITAFGWRFALPSAGMCASDECPLDDRLIHLILPTDRLQRLAYVATWSRFTRSSMLEVVKTDYMRRRPPKGLARPPSMVLKHGLKNALIPVVTIVSLSMPYLVAGAVVTETIFAWPGMGRLFYNGLTQFDFALLMGYLMLVSFLVVVCNLAADIAYAWLDPRVKYD